MLVEASQLQRLDYYHLHKETGFSIWSTTKEKIRLLPSAQGNSRDSTVDQQVGTNNYAAT
jgi:hypothetical protein